MNLKPSQRALKAARDNAVRLANRAKNLTGLKEASSWNQLSTKLGIDIPDFFKIQEFTYANVSSFAHWWISGFEDRLIKQLNSVTLVSQPLELSKDVQSFGSITLFNEQQSVVDAIEKKWFVERKSKVALQDGETGCGKTYVACGLIANAIKAKRHEHPVLQYARYVIVTRKSVLIHWRRILEQFGLKKYLGNEIIVTSYSQLSATFSDMFVDRKFDPYSEEWTIKFRESMAPFMVVWDEFHALGNASTEQTKFAMALQKLTIAPYQLFMSATPFVTIQNSRTFVIATKHRFMGMLPTEENWNSFAGLITNEPSKPNLAAAKRLREMLQDFIFPMPYVRWPHKAINAVKIVEFLTQEDRQFVRTAYDRYLEACERAGKNTSFGQFEKLVAFGQYRKATEPVRIEQVVDLGMNELNNGNAILIGCAYRESVAKCVFGFIRKGYRRDQISVIWGGKREIKQNLLLTESQIEGLLTKEIVTPEELRMLQETIAWRTERAVYKQTDEEQRLRHAQMAEIGLTGTQNASRRQDEIDRFQSGHALICVFTLAAGGVGLSLDDCGPNTRPRVGFFSPVYSGPEFKQALGRAVRRTTRTDTRQYIVYLKDTIEEWHVAPLVDKKLKCIATITNNKFSIIDLTNPSPKGQAHLRTEMEVLEDSNNPESQFHATDSDESDIDESEENGD